MMTAYPRDERAGGAEPEMVRRRLSGPGAAAALVALVLLVGGPASAREEQYKCAMGRDCFLYLPDEMDANRTYWLVVGVHAYRGKGKGAAGLAGWVRKGNCVVVGPSFPNGYQMLGHESDKQLIGVLGELHKKYKLHKKVFLYGFSGGSQFAHRFAMKYPELVGGCASHSGGSWGTVHPKARGVLFAVSTGEADGSRLDGAKRFFGLLQAGRFHHTARIWPGVGHRKSPGSRRITEECFALATTGLYPGQKEAMDKEIAAIDALIEAKEHGQALGRLTKLPDLEPPPPPPPGDSTAKGGGEGRKKMSPSENAWGWQESKEGRAALRQLRAVHLGPVIAARMDKIEQAGLAKVAAIEKGGGGDALKQLAALREQFGAAPKTAARIDALKRKLIRAGRVGRTDKPASRAGAESAEKKAQSKLNLAQVYLSANRKERAIEILKGILKSYPKTPAAEKARERLAELGVE